MAKKSAKLKVIVCGAGIGGLTVAHELAKHGIDVVVYERNSEIGGLARSAYYVKNGYNYPVEYSWRVYGTGYKNLLRLLKEIPLLTNNARSVFNNLVKAATYIFPRTNKPELIFSPNSEQNYKAINFPLTEDLKILEKILLCTTMSTGRLNSFDHLTWREFCADLSPEASNYLVKMWGPVLGMDPTYMSFSVVARFVGVIAAKHTGLADAVFLMNQPTSEGWFANWTAALEATGHVTLKTNVELQDLSVTKKHINSLTLRNTITNEIFVDTADYIVCGLGVEAIAAIVAKNPALAADQALTNTIELARVSHQVQLSVQIFLSQSFVYPTDQPPILYLPDSPWALIIEDQSLVWGQTHSADPRVKAVLSVGICQTDAPGSLHKKAFTACTKLEIEQEVIAEISKAYAASKIRLTDGHELSPSDVVLFYLWDSFTFDIKTKQLSTWEPKFSNNAGSLQYQPTTTTTIDNFLFATAYTKTQRFIYSMESATEAGLAAANVILARANIAKPKTILSFGWCLPILRPLAWLDALFFRLRLPHPGRFFGQSSIMLVVLYLLCLPAILILIICNINLWVS